jgi:hypothetical protein
MDFIGWLIIGWMVTMLVLIFMTPKEKLNNKSFEHKAPSVDFNKIQTMRYYNDVVGYKTTDKD